MNENYEKWDELAPRGLLIIGLGVSILGQAVALKAKSKGFLSWFLMGTIGLVALNAGVSIFGEAVKHRTLYEIEVKNLRENA
ncbi:MAG: hypothetical protein OHK0046_13340 [Anaerolineae bacterium]